MVEERFQRKNGYEADCDVIYGDTDSVMVHFRVKARATPSLLPTLLSYECRSSKSCSMKRSSGVHDRGCTRYMAVVCSPWVEPTRGALTSSMDCCTP